MWNVALIVLFVCARCVDQDKNHEAILIKYAMHTSFYTQPSRLKLIFSVLHIHLPDLKDFYKYGWLQHSNNDVSIDWDDEGVVESLCKLLNHE